jgi:hypothetical protein
MEAETVKAARSQLRAQALVPLKVDPVVAGETEGPMVQAPTPRVAFLHRACSMPRNWPSGPGRLPD